LAIGYWLKLRLSPFNSTLCQNKGEAMRIKVAHSVDSDDAFMFYGLASGKVDTGELKFIHQLYDIETLNRKALNGEFELSAISFHAYAYVSDKYALLPCGASIGERYGPILVATKHFELSQLKKLKIAVPGTMTTAYLTLKLLEPHITCKSVPFDKIFDAVKSGDFDAGLIIHEGQLTYEQHGLVKIIDLGEWWDDQTRLPLPLGGNIIRRDLGNQRMVQVAKLLKRSIEYALSHQDEALKYAHEYARGMEVKLTQKFVGMYVNELTLDCGQRGREAVKRLLELGYQKGIIPHKPQVDFVDI
jgi:1,4-dihydroxy-6-naphthoate synthase